MQGILTPVAEYCRESEKSMKILEEKSLSFRSFCGRNLWFWVIISIGFILGAYWIFGPGCFAQASLPGSDASDKLEAAGTLLRLLDTALFKWGARIFAGICIMSSAWSLKEQRFGIAIICIVGALIFGTAPTWVKNIFSIGTGDSIFSN